MVTAYNGGKYDEATKLGEGFISKYPTSGLEPNVKGLLTLCYASTRKFDQCVKVGEDFLGKFPANSFVPRVKLALVFCYVDTNNLDKAFATGADVLKADQNNFRVLYALAVAASYASTPENTKYDADGLTYAMRVLDVVKAGPPPGVAAADWDKEKAKVVGPLHQAAWRFLFNKGDVDGAIEQLKRASELDPKDPTNFERIGDTLQAGKYVKLFDTYKKLTDDEKVADQGKALLEQVNQVVDQMIETYAHAVALAEADAKFQAVAQRARATLVGFYKYRHNSTDGLEELIKKYKPGA
jgi:tetratricopeptide (TPR) repeat protein